MSADKALESQDDLVARLSRILTDFISEVPATERRATDDPLEAARSIARTASLKAAAVSGTLALPPGPAAWITILPDLAGVWKIQKQMVADIAGVYGKKACLTPEQMLYCMFRHVSAQAVRGLVVRVGERVLVRRVSLRTLQSIVRRIGIRVTQRIIGRGISRWLPVVGAVGVAGYAFYDTGQVAHTAIELFGGEVEIEGNTSSDKTVIPGREGQARSRRPRSRKVKR